MITSSVKSGGRATAFSAEPGGVVMTSILKDTGKVMTSPPDSGDGEMASSGCRQSDDILARAKR